LANIDPQALDDKILKLLDETFKFIEPFCSKEISEFAEAKASSIKQRIDGIQ